ncbi:cytochrome P450 [Ramaria rubella]|nr:cytochrome P450 [Ramaria rubella]
MVVYSMLRKGAYDDIPTIGGTGVWSSYFNAINFFSNGKDMVQLGYEKYQAGVFRISQIDRWHVIVSGKTLIEELRRAPEDTLSIAAAFDENYLVRHLLGPTIGTNPYHLEIIRTQMARNLGNLFPDLHDEVVNAFEDNIPVTGEWTKIPASRTIQQIVARVTNRIFVGAPLCRDPRYIRLNIKYAMHVVKAHKKLLLFPNFFKPLAAILLTDVPESVKLGMKHLSPLIEKRQRNIDEYGLDYPDKPNDFLSWMMDEVEGDERTPIRLTNRILMLNFVAIHTSSMTFINALFHLAAQPEYLAPMREEVEAIVAEDGWTKAAIAKMRKLDSFFKESQRMNVLHALSISRKTLKDFRFSDGTRIPKGTLVSAPADAIHHDNAVYPNASTFDGFRFSDIPGQAGHAVSNQFVATNPEYIPFGYGKHACPGRFFAANELKLMMAHLVINYDVNLEKEGVRPSNRWYALECVPDTEAEVVFRRRKR